MASGDVIVRTTSGYSNTDLVVNGSSAAVLQMDPGGGSASGVLPQSSDFPVSFAINVLPPVGNGPIVQVIVQAGAPSFPSVFDSGKTYDIAIIEH